MCFGCSKNRLKETVLLSTQNINNKNNFQLHTLIWGPVIGLGGEVGGLTKPIPCLVAKIVFNFLVAKIKYRDRVSFKK